MLAGSPLARWPSQTSIARTANVCYTATALPSVLREASFDNAVFRFTASPIAPHKDAFVSSNIAFDASGEAQADYFGAINSTIAWTTAPADTRQYRYPIGKNEASFYFAGNAEPDRTELFSPAPARFGVKVAASTIGPVGNVFPVMQFTVHITASVIYEGFSAPALFNVISSATSTKQARGYANPATHISIQASAEPAVTRDGVKVVDASGSAGFELLPHLDKKIISFTYQSASFAVGVKVIPYIIFTDSVDAKASFEVSTYSQVLRPKNAQVSSFFSAEGDIATVILQPTVGSSIPFVAAPTQALRIANNEVTADIGWAAQISSSVVKTPVDLAVVFAVEADTADGVRIATTVADAELAFTATGAGINKPKVIATPKPVSLEFTASGLGAITQLGGVIARMQIKSVVSGSLNDLQPAPLWRTIELEEENRGIMLEAEDRSIEL